MRSRRPSAIGAALRSILIPGWGQLVTRQTRIGKILVFLTGLMVIAALTVFLFVEPIEIAAWLANPDVILGIILLNLAFLVIRLFSTEAAWRAGGGHRVFAALFLAVIVSIPHVAVGWVGLETRDTLLRLFPAEDVALAAPLPTTETATSSTSTTATTTIPSTTTTLPTTTTSVPATTTSTAFTNPLLASPGENTQVANYVQEAVEWRPFGEERLNILLLGGDAGPGRAGLRTDTMIVASIDPVSGDAALIGVPRNFADVTLTDGTPVPVRQIGHVYGWGQDQPDRFGERNSGALAVSDVISNITGLHIDYFVLVDLTGFADVVDAFGGVRLDVADPVDGPLYDVDTGGYDMVRIPEGTQHLDGARALAYARARYGSSDYVRMGRQRCILASMATQADFLYLFGRLGNLLDVIESNMVTDIPVELIPDLIRLTPRVSAASTRMLGFDSKWGSGRTATGHVVPDVERIREAVRATIQNPDSASDFGAATAEDGC